MCAKERYIKQAWSSLLFYLYSSHLLQMRFNILSVCLGLVMMASLAIAQRVKGTVFKYRPDLGSGLIIPADGGRKNEIIGTSFRDPNLKKSLKNGDTVEYTSEPKKAFGFPIAVDLIRI